MRVDKFLKAARLIKRRSAANEACDGGRISVNGKVCKPGHTLKAGDILRIRYSDSELIVKVAYVDEKQAKRDGAELYTVIE